MKLQVYDKKQFELIVSAVTLPKYSSLDFVYDVYVSAVDLINDLIDSQIIPHSQYISPSDIIFFVLGEYVYSIASRSEEEANAFNQNDGIKQSMGSVVVDKYIGLSVLPFKEKKIVNKFLPNASSLSLYLNVISNILNNYH